LEAPVKAMWFELRSDWHLGMVRERVLPRVECSRCGVWAGAASYPTTEAGKLADLDLDSYPTPQGLRAEAEALVPRTMTPREFTVLARAVQTRLPEVEGCVTPGMSFGIASEWTRAPKPRPTKAVQFLGLYEGVLLGGEAYTKARNSALLASATWLPVVLRNDRDRTPHAELKFPFAGRSPSWLWSDDEHPCPVCGRGQHTWRGVLRSSIPEEATHFNLADFPTKFLVREDLAALLGRLAGPTLTFVPVEMHDDAGR
jgi:hypothetical protein